MTGSKDTRKTGLMDEDGRLASKVVLEEKADSTGLELSMFAKIGPAMAVTVCALILAYTVPSLAPARPWKPGDPVPFWNLIGRPFEAEEAAETEERVAKVDSIAREALEEEPEPEITPEREIVEVEPGERLPAYQPHPDDDKPVEQPLELFEGSELDVFFGALARSDAGIAGAKTRVVHWGDSAIGVDGITSAIRKRMQSRFGDAGHGFHAIAPPNVSYRHRGVKFSQDDRWKLCFIIRRCRSDGHYGLAGTIAESREGAQSTFAPDPKHSSGHVSRFELWYAGRPGGGKIRLRVDREPSFLIETDAEELEDRWHAIDVPDGPHKLRVEAIGGRKVRLYGVTMEREGPGIVWDGLALVGAFTNRLGELEEGHLRAQLEHRAPQLAVFTFGGNDMVRQNLTMDEYEGEYRAVIRRVRRARPDMSCILMSPLDHGIRDGVRIVSMPVVPQMVAAQRNVARSEGCAFFDTYAAMGGEGSAGRWFKQKPRLISGDLSHVTYKGQIVIGEMFYRALTQAYVAYRERTR